MFCRRDFFFPRRDVLGCVVQSILHLHNLKTIPFIKLSIFCYYFLFRRKVYSKSETFIKTVYLGIPSKLLQKKTMAENILTKDLTGSKQKGVSLVDASVIAVSKPLIEAAFNLLRVGNNNLVSAAVKVVGAGAISKFADGKTARNVSTAMLVSAVDDVVTRFIPGVLSGKTAKNVQVVGGSDSNQSAQAGAYI